MAPQESEEEDDQEEQETPRRRRSIQESLSLPVPVCYPGTGQKDVPGESKDGCRSKAELSSSPSLSPSLGDSVESSGSPSLSSPKDTLSPHSPTGFMRNAKKGESKGKGKELKGMQDQTMMVAIEVLFVALLLSVMTFVFFQRSQMRPHQQENPKDDFQTLGKSP